MYWYLILVLLIPQMTFAETAPRWTILIDPGHGGVDHGAVYSGLRESDVVLSVGKKLKDLFNGDERFKIQMSRAEDSAVALPDRIAKAEKHAADLIVSLHANAAGDARAKGIELFVQNPMAVEEEALFLAHQENQIIKQKSVDDSRELSKTRDIAAIVEDLRRQNKFFKSLELTEILKKSWKTLRPKTPLTIKQAPFFVVSQGTIPSVLVEIGFLTHPQESKLLKNPAYLKEIAEIIHRGVMQYLGADQTLEESYLTTGYLRR